MEHALFVASSSRDANQTASVTSAVHATDVVRWFRPEKSASSTHSGRLIGTGGNTSRSSSLIRSKLPSLHHLESTLFGPVTSPPEKDFKINSVSTSFTFVVVWYSGTIAILIDLDVFRTNSMTQSVYAPLPTGISASHFFAGLVRRTGGQSRSYGYPKPRASGSPVFAIGRSATFVWCRNTAPCVQVHFASVWSMGNVSGP